MLELAATRRCDPRVLIAMVLWMSVGTVSSAWAAAADIEGIIEDLSASGSLGADGESVVRYLIDKGLEPDEGQLYVDLGLRLYDLGQDKASAAVLAAYHLRQRKVLTPTAAEPVLPSVTPPPAWKPTHRVMLTNGQVMKGVPLDRDSAGFWLETELGSRIRLESSEITAVEPLDREGGA